ncbi:hypothetical protein [Massilia genomosp. 1]|uniref:Transmembrane protein n=1 Tax=Massilia genomosp. 1 TaxID=2609280 RepID=A0ABX0MLH7_9BURK|nr:hypothetical protein [Massilia genomosp. 1]NHZ63647.1 hypothetical protein [Massilia genomosp. 1]
MNRKPDGSDAAWSLIGLSIIILCILWKCFSTLAAAMHLGMEPCVWFTVGVIALAASAYAVVRHDWPGRVIAFILPLIYFFFVPALNFWARIGPWGFAASHLSEHVNRIDPLWYGTIWTHGAAVAALVGVAFYLNRDLLERSY